MPRHQFRPRLYTFSLCLIVGLLLAIQLWFGPITTVDEIPRQLSRRGLYIGPSSPPTYLLPQQSYIRPSLAASRNVLDDVTPAPPTFAANCRMDNCFDFTKCRNGFKVFVYPQSEGYAPSEQYLQFTNIIKSSSFYTSHADEACIFVSNYDTLDRDPLSSTDYVHNLQNRLSSHTHWNGGKNHVIFNLYSGTWPDYSENFGVDIGHAMLAKASISSHRFRAGFDISLPLFHKSLPACDGEKSRLMNINVPSNRKYLLSFKGKRYLTGIGSVSRNSLYHAHNGQDIILLTTCKHGNNWQKFADERCTEDNDLYDKYDFNDLLANSTFCLVPRGRRLGSFRFLEVLQYGCIPVLLSDNWELPFSDVIDWSKAAVWADENLLYQIPHSLRSMPHSKINTLQQQSQLLWSKYFSSLEKIVTTSLQIIKDRVELHRALSLGAWNTNPGAHALNPSYSMDLTLFPFFVPTNSSAKFTALVYITGGSPTLRQFVANLASASYVHTIYLFVITKEDILGYVELVSQSITQVPVHVRPISTISESYRLAKEFPTDAVLTIRQRDRLHAEEINFVFSVWKEYPTRLVGHLSRSHLWHNGELRYHYTSKLTDEYSMVLLDTSVVHKYFLYQLSRHIDKWPDYKDYCADILLNYIVSDVTSLPPVKVGQRLTFQSSSEALGQHNSCIYSVYKRFGYSPLKHSQVRLDPALFKDNVSKRRKRYVVMEKVS